MVVRIFILATLLFSSNAYSDISTQELLESCDKKTIVFGNVDGDVKQVGKKLGGYCKGYIEGHLSALKGKVCLESDNDTHFIVSLIKQYQKEKPSTTPGK